MTEQNYTQFAETDPNGRISVAASSLTIASLLTGESVRVARDLYGARLGDFSHTLTVTYGETGQSLARTAVWAAANTLDTVYNWSDLVAQAVYLELRKFNTNILFNLVDAETGNSDSLTVPQTVGATYYVTITRSGASLTAQFYTDAARTDLADTLTIAVPAARRWRYLFGLNGYGAGSTKILPNLVLAHLETSAMADCVLESIMKNLKTTLDALVTSGDLAHIERPVRGVLPTRPQHTSAVLYQDDPTEADPSHGAKAWLLPVAVDLFIRPADGSTEAVDTTINNLRATVEAKLTEDTTCGGYAHDLRIRAPQSFVIGDQFEGVRVNAEVRFSTDEDDPFSQR